MASYQQMYYCKNCKKNVPVNDKGQCAVCRSTQIKKSWTVRFRVVELNGEKQKRLTGFSTKKEAEKAYVDFMSNFKPLQNNEKYSLIFENVLADYFKTYKLENAVTTIYDKEHSFQLYITPYFKGKDIREISKIDLQSWQLKLWTMKSEKTHKNFSWRYASKIRGFLFNFLEYCKNLYDIPNLLGNIKVPKNKDMKKDMRFWEIETFAKFIDKVEDPLWKTLWTTFMFTGARFNEVRALTVDDIKDNTIYITKALPGKKAKVDKYIAKTTKNGKTVIKQIPDVLASQLKDYIKWRNENNITGNYLFGGDKPLSEGTIRRKLKEHTLLSQVNYINPHGFRHSYVSLLINLGVSTKVIAELIGDTEIQVISTYGHLYADAKTKAISLLNEKLNTICA